MLGLYTTVCSGQSLPSGISQQNASTMIAASTEEWQYTWRFNDAEYSKKAHSRLFVEMKAFILKVVFSRDVLFGGLVGFVNAVGISKNRITGGAKCISIDLRILPSD